MSSLILSKYLCPDLVNYFLDFIMVSKETVKKNYSKIIKRLKPDILTCNLCNKESDDMYKYCKYFYDYINVCEKCAMNKTKKKPFKSKIYENKKYEYEDKYEITMDAVILAQVRICRYCKIGTFSVHYFSNIRYCHACLLDSLHYLYKYCLSHSDSKKLDIKYGTIIKKRIDIIENIFQQYK